MTRFTGPWSEPTQFEFIDQLVDALGLREPLANVALYSFAADIALVDAAETIMIYGSNMTQDFGSLGDMRTDELYRVQGVARVLVPADRLQESTARAARQRVKALVTEVQNELRENPTRNGAVQSAILARGDQSYIFLENGCVGIYEFEIAVTANLYRTGLE